MFYRLRAKYSGPGPYADWETCNHDLDSPAAQQNLQHDAFPDFEPQFQPVLLSRESALVDFVNATGVVGGSGLLVSERALRILERMKLPPWQAYPLEVFHGEKRIASPRYFWMQILLFDNYGWIDYAASEFSIKHHLDMDESAGEPLEVRSERELKEIIEARKGEFHILSGRTTLNSAYARVPFDLFYLDWLGGLASSYPIISGNLKAALESEPVSGYRLTQEPAIVLGR